MKKKTPFSETCMDLEVIILSEVERERQIMISLTCGVHNMVQMNLFMKQKQTETDSQRWRTDLSLPRGRSWRMDGLGFWE